MNWYHRFVGIEKNYNAFAPRLDSLQRSVDGISKSLLGLIIYLKGKDKAMDTSLFQANSPIQLSPLGEKLLEESGGKGFVDSNLELLFKKITSTELKSALDVENASTAAILLSTDMDEFTEVKDFIYNNPFYKSDNGHGVAIEISTLANLMGIYLRNKYLAAYPEFLHK